MIKTLADFKRLKAGTKLLTVQGAQKYRGTVREIFYKQTNAIKFVGGSWLEYPKASDFRIDGDSIFIESKTKDGRIWNTLEYKLIN